MDHFEEPLRLPSVKHPLLLCLFFGCLTALAQAEPPTIFIVRHAERADAASGSPATMPSDPDLSEAGRVRAESLGSALKDAAITAIYVTEYKRTQQTAAPLAKATGISVTIAPAKETGALIAKLRSSRGNALVIGHSNTLPEIIKALGVSTPVTIPDSEYDNLFVVTPGSPARLIHLHYQ
ncbi:MAG: histidine phosphatase family protein [Verrucomicrobiota bacterium]